VRTDASGQAALSYAGASQGKDVIGATITLNNAELPSNPAQVTWDAGKHVTFLSLDLGPRSGVPGQAVGVIASLTDTSVSPPVPLAGQSVQFTLGSAQCSAPTDAAGLATCQITPSQPGIHTLMAAFAGTDQLTAASASRGFNLVSMACIPLGCDDGDACTTDACVDGQCVHTPGAGYAGVTCYLDASAAALQSASRTDVKPGLRKAFQRKVRGIIRLVQKAQGGGRKGTKARRKADHGLAGLVAKLGKLHHPKIDATFDQRLKTLLSSAKTLLEALRAS